MMLSAKTFLIMEEKKILPRISDWEEKYPLHPLGNDKSYLEGWSSQKDAEICRRRTTDIMKTKFLFKASLNSVPLFYLLPSLRGEGSIWKS